MNRDSVAYTCARVSNDGAAVLGLGVARLRVIRRSGSLADTENVAPFLEFLGIVSIIQGVITDGIA